MNQQDPTRADDDEISLIDILIFLIASGKNIVKSTLVCLALGGAYYFSVPKMYEATATVAMATVEGDPVEAPAVLLEKMKLPLYFAPATLQACGSDGQVNSQAKFVDKIKPTINKSAPFVSLATQAQSTQEAKACLSAVIAEVNNKQAAIAKPLIDQKKQKLSQLSDQLKLAEDMAKNFPTTKSNIGSSDTQFSSRTLAMSSTWANATEMNDLRKEINNLENSLIPPQTQPLSLAAAIYAPEVPINKRPLFTLGLCLGLGVFLGLLVTGLMRAGPEIRRQMREAELS
jgi:LPS O-antigen subunit length determinant protein (WzzB/FepE family)